MGRAVIAAKPDTYVSSGKPTARNSTNASLYVGSGLQTFILAALGGIPEGATVRSAYLDLYGADALAAASRAVAVSRVNGSWSAAGRVSAGAGIFRRTVWYCGRGGCTPMEGCGLQKQDCGGQRSAFWHI